MKGHPEQYHKLKWADRVCEICLRVSSDNSEKCW